MLLLDAPVTVREVMTHEEVPLAGVFREVGRFLIGRDDVVLFGAQAVNVYAATERMTQNVDVMSTRAQAVADELQALLTERSHIAIRVSVVVPEELVAMKVFAMAARRGRPKELSDRLDVKRLLLALPELRRDGGAVSQRLLAAGASDAVLNLWRQIIQEPNVDDEDDTW